MRTPPRCVLSLWLCSVSIAFLFPACKPGEPYDRHRIDQLRAGAETLIRAQALMGYQSWAFGLPSNQDSLYRAHAALFTKENILLVERAESAEPDTVQRLRLRYLRRYLTTEYIAKEVAPLSDQVTNVEAAATVTVGGAGVPYRQLGALLANERSQQRRALLYTAADPVLDSLNVLHRGIEERYRVLAADLGYRSYTTMVETLKGFSLTGLAVVAEEVLVQTDSLYTALRNELVPRILGITPAQFRRYDTARLFRSSEFDVSFPADRMMETVRATFGGLGIQLDSLTNLRVDAEARARRRTHAPSAMQSTCRTTSASASNPWAGLMITAHCSMRWVTDCTMLSPRRMRSSSNTSASPPSRKPMHSSPSICWRIRHGSG